jgi:aconitate hydratase
VVEIDLSSIGRTIAGPKRPHDRVALADANKTVPASTINYPTIQVRATLPGADADTMVSSVATPLENELAGIASVHSISSQTTSAGVTYVTLQFKLDYNIDAAAQDVRSALSAVLPQLPKEMTTPTSINKIHAADKPVTSAKLDHGDIVIAAITSCTNTSNPRSMVTAGLLARNAVARGLQTNPRIKTTLSPGSRAVAEYLRDADLLESLAKLGFAVVGFGCATCVGNTGDLDKALIADIKANDLSVAAVLSGNRNFEGRIHANVKLNYLASPPLVVAYALAGTMRRNLESEPLGIGDDNAPIYLRDIWPDESEVEAVLERFVTPGAFRETSVDIFAGGPRWNALPGEASACFPWQANNSYIGPSPFVEAMAGTGSIMKAAPLLVLGDNVTTDHISPVGTIPKEGPAAEYLRGCGVADAEFNAFGARRGNAEVMARGTFANPRLKNELATREGGWTKLGDVEMPIYEAATKYREAGTPVVVVAGKNYGAGSARDWAAKGTLVLGIRAVLAESFERIHRANLVLMGVLPLQFEAGQTRADLDLDAESRITIALPESGLQPRQAVEVIAEHPTKGRRSVKARARLDTALDAQYFAQGGVLPAILKKLIA